jgi:hypothetical protein
VESCLGLTSQPRALHPLADLNSLLSAQQCGEAGLFEVAVSSERLGKALFLHNNKRNAIHERPLLVASLGEDFNSTLKKARLSRNDFDAWMHDQDSVKI